MDKKTAKKILNKFEELEKCGELIPNKALIKPKSELDFIKKSLCQVFVDFANESKEKYNNEQIANILEMDRTQFSLVVNFHLDRFTLDFLVIKLSILSKYYAPAKKTLHRMGTAA